ncbi:hypothetical protein L2Y94_10485 [Luteibacter aegosomatis]|uniref:hypothetical protein n=1 Tax=Luteibacter aegosomatis TaxID=2911537 RepID=UPI001FF8D707|nr:hypothetical protein [Luteibacter aegosomatis]UPG87755.1 hypothetical protein L2Y94_10485 [Luteibacter aegosomatis]
MNQEALTGQVEDHWLSVAESIESIGRAMKEDEIFFLKIDGFRDSDDIFTVNLSASGAAQSLFGAESGDVAATLLNLRHILTTRDPFEGAPPLNLEIAVLVKLIYEKYRMNGLCGLSILKEGGVLSYDVFASIGGGTKKRLSGNSLPEVLGYVAYAS